ncbi:hypothetical protein BC828DRAFT_389358 [Blastocladiella britannica]|nr:hypothetical protein BC828DRAFT_389358 [Blastocladiella britannica]
MATSTRARTTDPLAAIPAASSLEPRIVARARDILAMYRAQSRGRAAAAALADDTMVARACIKLACDERRVPVKARDLGTNSTGMAKIAAAMTSIRSRVASLVVAAAPATATGTDDTVTTTRSLRSPPMSSAGSAQALGRLLTSIGIAPGTSSLDTRTIEALADAAVVGRRRAGHITAATAAADVARVRTECLAAAVHVVSVAAKPTISLARLAPAVGLTRRAIESRVGWVRADGAAILDKLPQGAQKRTRAQTTDDDLTDEDQLPPPSASPPAKRRRVPDAKEPLPPSDAITSRVRAAKDTVDLVSAARQTHREAALEVLHPSSPPRKTRAATSAAAVAADSAPIRAAAKAPTKAKAKARAKPKSEPAAAMRRLGLSVYTMTQASDPRTRPDRWADYESWKQATIAVLQTNISRFDVLSSGSDEDDDNTRE